MNTLKMEANKHGEENVFSYLIDMSNSPQLSDIKYLPLSVNKDKVERFLIGKWIVFEGGSTYTEKNMIEFGEYNKIINSTIKKWRGDNTPDWEFEDHKFDNYTSFNSFNVNGMSTMEMIYIDEHIIYARGYADKDIIFIKEDSIGMFKSLKDITNYLYKKEAYWVNINNTYNEKHHDKNIKGSLVGLWILLTLGSVLFIPSITQNGHIVKWGLFLFIAIIIAVVLVIYYILRQKIMLKELITQYKGTDTSILLKAKLSGKY